jgi:integrase
VHVLRNSPVLNTNLQLGACRGSCLSTRRSTDRKRQRPRRTKSPAKIEGCEHRWSPAEGWRFRARMKVAGKVRVGTWTSKDQALADAAAMRQRRDSSAGVQFITLEQACQDVLDEVKGNDGTWRSYHEHFVTICDHFGPDLPLHEITTEGIVGLITARRAARVRGKPPSDGRIRKTLGALNRVFRKAMTSVPPRYLGPNPLDRIEKLKGGKRKHKDVFAVDEFVGMFEALRARTSADAQWDAAVVAALLFSGLRREGLCRITAAMIDDQAGFVRDIEQKESLSSVVAISRPLAHVLPTLIAHADATGHLIPGGVQRGPRKKGAKPRTDTERRTGTIDRVFKRCRVDLPEPLRRRFHPHALRHSLRTLLADNGVPEHVRDAITDHKPTTVGRGYEHATPAQVRHYARKVLDPLLWIVDPAAERPIAAAT